VVCVCRVVSGGVRTAYGETYGVGDHIGVLLDLEQGHLSFFKNGTRACRAVLGGGGHLMDSADNYDGAPRAQASPWGRPTPTCPRAPLFSPPSAGETVRTTNDTTIAHLTLNNNM
jgi:hypothetical protein